MAKTVSEAFSTFSTDCVNLEKSETDTARNSRDWLLKQIELFQYDNTFPKSYSEHDISYGSFARRTKIRPLDDIDVMICLSAQGSTYYEYSADRVEITANPHCNLNGFCNPSSDILNSTKVINKLVKKLEGVGHYKKAEIKRNGEAATLSLLFYDWTFDIVPCFMTAPESSGKAFYLIPDGKGNWKKTDPRIDKQRTTDINQNNDGYVLNVIRIIKYWNKRSTMPSMSSYLLETMILDYYENTSETVSSDIVLEILRVLGYLLTAVFDTVSDPKGIQGDINDLSYDVRNKISTRSSLDVARICEAIQFECDGKQKEAINKWREIFGSEFPEYV